MRNSLNLLIYGDLINYMDKNKIKKNIKSTFKDAEELIKDPNKIKDLFNQIKNNSVIVDNITKQVKELPLLINLLRDYFNGEYNKIPKKSIIAIIATLLYIVNPFDLIPDAIPIIGVSDDISALLFCINLINDDIQEYKRFKTQNNDVIDVEYKEKH